MARDYYDALGVSRTASTEEMQRATAHWAASTTLT